MDARLGAGRLAAERVEKRGDGHAAGATIDPNQA
jgi:hypothetical protein